MWGGKRGQEVGKKVQKTKTATRYSPKEIRRDILEYNFWIGYCVLLKIRRGLVYRHNIRYESLLWNNPQYIESRTNSRLLLSNSSDLKWKNKKKPIEGKKWEKNFRRNHFQFFFIKLISLLYLPIWQCSRSQQFLS